MTLLCPVHGDRRPSLRVNLEKGLFFCQACEAKGNALHLVMAMDSVDRVEAQKRLDAIAKAAGVETRQSIQRRYTRPGEGRTAAPTRRFVPPGRRST